MTTPLLDTIAHSYGVEVYNTLTGFKWICGKMNELEKSSPNKNFIFATEESFGYLCHTFARDKDGVSSVSQMAEVAFSISFKDTTSFKHSIRYMKNSDFLEKIYCLWTILVSKDLKKFHVLWQTSETSAITQS